MRLIVPPELAGKRADAALFKLSDTYSRSTWSKILKQGAVRQGAQSLKPSTPVKPGALLVADHIPQLGTKPVLPPIYEDESVIVINKPSGLLSHAKGELTAEWTVASCLEQGVNSDTPRQGIVHRLDRDTSGVMIVAKTPEASMHLQRQFAGRHVVKHYRALVSGNIDQTASIELPIGRNPKRPSRFRVDANGKPALSIVEPLKHSEQVSLVDINLKTGRTHQIRVHLSHIGHPVIGDAWYGGKANSRLMLHAYSLELTLPNSERKVFTAPLPPEFKRV